jgi:hypothetical protein
MAKIHPFWRLIPPPCPGGEQIENGTFETGDLTGWTNAQGSVTDQYAHTGTYSILLYSNWYLSCAMSVPKVCIASFGFWSYQVRSGNYYVIIYTDGSESDHISIPYTADWAYVDVKAQVADGKSIKNIYFRGGTAGPGWVDDVSLIGSG